MKRFLVLLITLSIALLTAETVIDEGFNGTSLPANWSQEYVQGNNSWMTFSGGHNGNPSGPHSGTRNAYIFAESCTTKLITPMLNVGGSSTATLSFWYAHVIWAGHQDILNVYYRTEPTGNWIQIQSYPNNITDWTHVTLNLPNESSSYFIAFEAVCDWGHGVVLDDVIIEGDPSPVGVVEGHVYNENGIPLTGAEVLIEDVNMSTFSLPGGFYQIVAVPEGNHPFFASLDGYGFDMTSATIIAGETITLDFYLNEYIEVIVNGTVLTEIGNDPVQGATVILQGFANYQTQTAANGQFIIPGVYSENEYDLTVTKPSHNPYYDTIIIEEENYNCGTINIFAPVEVYGWVNTTAFPDSGLVNAQVNITGYANHNTSTDSLGYFLIDEVYANEDYLIEISFPNHNPYTQNLEITGYDVDLGAVTLISPVALSGHVVTNIDPNTGIEGAEIELTGFANHNTFSDSMGYFLIQDIYANEDYQLTVSFTNHHIHSENISILQADLDLGTIELIAPIDINGWINTTAHPDSGLANAEISLTGYETHNVQSAANGQFLISNVYALEEYDIEVNFPNHNPYTGVVDVYEEDIDLGTLTLISPINIIGCVVSNSDPQTGLYDADVDLSGYAFHTTNTDSLGNFILDDVYANEDYQISIDYPDHNIFTQDIDVEADHIDLGTITLIGPVTVSGYVYGSDNLISGLANAELELDGNYDYDTVSDSTGFYVFENVFANQIYTISVEAENYNGYEAEIEVQSANLILEDITVVEETFPAGNVNALILDEFSTAISWNPPGSNSTFEFRYDDGNPVNQIGLNGSTYPNNVIGAIHEYYAVIDQIKWFLTNAHTHNYVKLFIFGLNANGMPNSNNLLYQSANVSSQNNQWRTHNLTSPVVAPNGFLVGIHVNNQWSDLALDDGDDEPWVFQPGTQFSTPNWQSGSWTDISSYPNVGNLLLRAYGLNLGPPLRRDLESYKLFRMLDVDISDPDEWELVADNIQDTTFIDTTWWYLNEGEWYYAVRCQHTNGVESFASFSNALDKDAPPNFEVNLYISNSQGDPIQFANTSLISFYNSYISNSDAQGLADYPSVNPGIYDLHVSRNGYQDYDLEDILITSDMDFDITLFNSAGENNEVNPITTITGIYPNPFNPETDISFELIEDSQIIIEVYNSKGQKVDSILRNSLPSGSHTFSWKAEKHSSGIYFIRFQAGNINQLRKIALIK